MNSPMFQDYLNSIQQTRQAEAQDHIQKVTAIQNTADQVTNAIQQHSQEKLLTDQQMGLYQSAFHNSSYAQQMPDVPTLQEQDLLSKKDTLQSRADEIRANIAPLSMNLKDVNNGRAIYSVQRKVDNYNRLLEEINKQQSDVDAQLNVEKTKPDYLIQKQNAKFAAIVKTSPLYSGQYYDVMKEGQQRPDKQSEVTQGYAQRRAIDQQYKDANQNIKPYMDTMTKESDDLTSKHDSGQITDDEYNQKISKVNDIFKAMANTQDVKSVASKVAQYQSEKNAPVPKKEDVKPVKKLGFIAQRKADKEAKAKQAQDLINGLVQKYNK